MLGVTILKFFVLIHLIRFVLKPTKKKKKVFEYQSGGKIYMILHMYNHPEAKISECHCHDFGGSVLSSPTLYSRSEETGSGIPGFLIQNSDWTFFSWFALGQKGKWPERALRGSSPQSNVKPDRAWRAILSRLAPLWPWDRMKSIWSTWRSNPGWGTYGALNK